jgi:hypothetical protein
VQQTQVAGARDKKSSKSEQERLGGKMEQANSVGAAHEKYRVGIASLAIVAALFLFVGTVAVAAAHAQSTQASQTAVKIPSPSEHDTFGYAVAVSGNTMVVGAQGGDGVIPPALPTAAGLTFDTGVAYIYERSSGNTWVQTAKLIANDGVGLNGPFLPNDPANSGFGKADLFGTSVAISGDTVIIGAPAHTHSGFQSQSGAVYVFQKINGTWTQQAELHSPTPSLEGNFGTDQTVGISGNTIVVGDVGGPTNFFTPGVDVFTRTNGVWQNTATLQVPDDFFFEPSSVAIEGNTVVVGSTNSDGAGVPFGSAGAAYVFALKKSQWTQQAALAASDPSSGGAFGFSVSVEHGVVAVGAPLQPGTTSFSGAAYIFTGNEGVWAQKAKLQANDSAASDQFGNSVSVSGETVLVGAPQHSVGADIGAGAAYAFTAELGRWNLVAEVSASDVPGGDFGWSVAMQNGALVIGAPFQNPSPEGYAAGEVYVFQLRDN